MLTKGQVQAYQEQAAKMFANAGIFVQEPEKSKIEIADFNLDQFEQTGLGVLIYVNTERCCAKELAMWPRQTCPQHLHPTIDGKPGKEETFRCRWGTVYLYVPGDAAMDPQAKPPAGREHTYDIFHEIVLKPGDQYTLSPDTWHWFQSGDEGAVVSEFSTTSTDEADVFTDEDILRATEIVD
jgi:D-lyxose ketol-isomerase